MKFSFLLALFTTATATSIGYGARDEPSFLRGYEVDWDEDVDVWSTSVSCTHNCQCAAAVGGCPVCVSNCHCQQGGCSMPACTTNCKCEGSGCPMPACTNNCKCQAGSCAMPACTRACKCAMGNCDMEESSSDEAKILMALE